MHLSMGCTGATSDVVRFPRVSGKVIQLLIDDVVDGLTAQSRYWELNMGGRLSDSDFVSELDTPFVAHNFCWYSKGHSI